MDDNLRNRLLDIEARIGRKGDEALQEIREIYETFDEAQKQQFSNAMIRIDEGNELLRSLPLGFIRATVRTRWESRDNEGEIVAGGSGELSPRSLVAAIVAWDKGETFSTKGMRFTG
jgi:hypothetical protein